MSLLHVCVIEIFSNMVKIVVAFIIIVLLLFCDYYCASLTV
jgi:hypothetical protein